jgi:hypothetical protein
LGTKSVSIWACNAVFSKGDLPKLREDFIMELALIACVNKELCPICRDVNGGVLLRRTIATLCGFESSVFECPENRPWVGKPKQVKGKPVTAIYVDEWDALFEQAAALGPDCAERVRRRREQSDHPPSSICCGAAAKHRKRMIQEARDIIRSFQDGTAITDKTLNDTKAETD